MSNSSFEAIETAVRGVLETRGPRTEDELLEALVAAGTDFDDEIEDLIADVMDTCDELIVGLLDERWCWLPALLDGRVFTHRLSDVEVEHDMLRFGPDLAPLSILTDSETYQRLVDGSPVVDVIPELDDDVLAERGIPAIAVGDEGGWLLEPGRLASLGVSAGDLVGLRVAAEGFELIAVDAVTEYEVGSPLTELLEEHFTHPQMLGVAVWTVCGQDDALFRAPAAPLGELLDANGLPHEGDWVAGPGFSFDSWRATSQVQLLKSRHRLHDVEAMAVVTALHLHGRIRDWLDKVLDASDGNDWADDGTPLPHLLQRAEAATAQTDFGGGPEFMEAPNALALFEEPIVVEAFLSEASSHDGTSAMALALFANSFEKGTPRAARPAMLWLKGRAHEQAGEVELAEQAFRSAERLDPSWPLTLLSLARLASDKGDAERGLALLRRAGSPSDDPLVQLLEEFQPAPRPNLARNQPCWCGSGRKYKQCHLHREQLPLEERAAWLYQKAGGHLLEGPFAPVLIATLQERSRHWDGPDALAQAVEDGFVPDTVLFEGGGFAHFLAMRGPLLPPDEMLLAQQWLRVDRSVHEVVSVRPGESMQWRDVRTGDVHEVRERTASRQVKPGELYCARVVPAGETTQIFGGLEPVSLGERDQLIALLDDAPDPLELVAFLSRRFAPPVLLNTEGEPSVLCEATLRVTDPAGLAAALDREYDRQSDTPEDMAVWFEHVTTDGMERIRAELDLHEDELRIHANSEERFDRVLAVLGGLDPSATTLSETREPAGDLKAMQKLAGSSSKPRAEPVDPASDPAMAAALQEMVLKLEEAWLDDSIPALAGYTPRQCAEDPTRRPDLIKLLDSFPEDDGQPGQMSPARLRRALGLG